MTRPLREKPLISSKPSDEEKCSFCFEPLTMFSDTEVVSTGTETFCSKECHDRFVRQDRDNVEEGW